MCGGLEDIMEDFLQGCNSLYEEDIMLKGCMALKKQLKSTAPNFRLTQDIDFSIKNKSAWEEYIDNCCTLATQNSKFNINYEIIKRRGFDRNPNSDSINIKATLEDGGIVEFKVDMNIKPDDLKYSDNSDYIKLYNIYGILRDKIKVVMTKKVCRRVKDLIDIYMIITSIDIDYNKVLNVVDTLEPVENFLCMSGSKEIIEHAYDKYKNVDKPDFEDMLCLVIKFILPIVYRINYGKVIYEFTKWDSKKGKWV